MITEIKKHFLFTETYAEIQSKSQEIEALLNINIALKPSTPIENTLKIFSNFNIDVVFPDKNKPEPITQCIQSLLAVEVYYNPCSDTKNIVSQLLMLKRIKGRIPINQYPYKF